MGAEKAALKDRFGAALFPHSMNEAELLKKLAMHSEAKRIFERGFDFLPIPPSNASRLFKFSDGTTFEVVAKDGSGGEFALCTRRSLPTRPMLYASSEGQAGIIARSLETALSNIVELPFWKDCLKFSGGGKLAEMRRVIPLAESDLMEHMPGIASSRRTLRAFFDLPKIADSVEALHSAVMELSPLYQAYGFDGSPYASLFNTFTVTQNGAWRRRLELQG